MSKFRTTEISDPAFESHNLRYITVKTDSLKGRGDICVYVPNNSIRTDLPIAILLHGVYGSSWVWSLKAGAHLTAQRLIDENKIKPMILAMPSDGLWGDGSAYTAHNSLDFEKWIAEDVVDAVKELIPQAKASTNTFISGLSMGGFGALRIGTKYSNDFKAISAHSAITDISQMALFVEENLNLYKQTNSSDESVYLTMRKNMGNLPPIRFDCGKNDLLIEHNRKLTSDLSKSNIPHIYQEFDGQHEWDYWKTHLIDSLLFFNEHL